MAGNTAFEEFIAEEIKQYKGVYVPVKAGLLRRALIRWAPCDKLHPNPDDEFCSSAWNGSIPSDTATRR